MWHHYIWATWQDLKQNTEYHNYTPQSDQVQWRLVTEVFELISGKRMETVYSAIMA
jgi:hypothetical protein